MSRSSATGIATARASCPSLRGKHVTMHTLRHTAAMRLLHAGIDIAVIALWLGHEQITTTHTPGPDNDATPTASGLLRHAHKHAP